MTALLLGLLACRCTPPPPPPAGPHPTVRRSGVRIAVGEERVQLQAPILRWEGAGTIVGAVHVGEPGYYLALSDVLAPSSTVFFEGLTPDEAPPPEPAPPADLRRFDLSFQGDALAHDERWVHADLTVSELRRALVDADTPAELIHAMLDDRDASTLADLFGSADTPRLQALARLALIKHVGEPSPEHGAEADAYWDIIVGQRDAVVVDAVGAHPAADWAVVYGADHAWDLAARLHPERAPHVEWLPVIEVSMADLGLGQTQVRQLLGD